jgi:hypothetical protein
MTEQRSDQCSGGIAEDDDESKYQDIARISTLLNATRKLSTYHQSFALFVERNKSIRPKVLQCKYWRCSSLKQVWDSDLQLLNFKEGAPQNPMRVMGGFRITL